MEQINMLRLHLNIIYLLTVLISTKNSSADMYALNEPYFLGYNAV
jgi:hypothetical protein